jgi:two-component system response regulator YesN
VENPCELLQIGEIVRDYIIMLLSKNPRKKNEEHWLVSVMKKYAEEMFCEGIFLKEIAVTYQKNERYIGRLFKKETGVAFNEYCMQMRLKKAEALLVDSNEKVIDIAMECGFDNISYFNRVFQKKHGISPKAYRAKKKL